LTAKATEILMQAGVTSGLYYKHTTIVIDNASSVSESFSYMLRCQRRKLRS